MATAKSHSPLVGAVLVGGGSRRMGQPKQLLEIDGESVLDRIVRALAAVAPEWFLVGAGPMPPRLAESRRIDDLAGVSGPLAGLLGLFAFRADAAWLVLACDQPRMTAEALAWLAEERDESAAATLPRLSADRLEPFPGVYEPRSGAALARLARGPAKRQSLQRLPELAAVATPEVPPDFRAAFRGVNTPAELAELVGFGAADRVSAADRRPASREPLQSIRRERSRD